MVKPEEEFTNLTAKEPIKGGKFWKCECVCGKTVAVSKWHLEHNKRKSCGCRTKNPPTTYTCLRCEETKERKEFYLRKNGNLFHRVCKECKRKEEKEKAQKRHMKLRTTALTHYGGDPPQCECCGETQVEFLHLDHKNGDGTKHRAKLKSLNIYRWLKQHAYPNDLGLRVLCANCNMAIGAYGYCPHHPQRIFPPATTTKPSGSAA